ncbi:hypothetical protein IAR55_005817 [Kwoniella newhampshirensis]|uniref:non-specific serine/threonine protein kinase n=1 Tax=Kwoniella newhampshirensis TaxID=1651941 RepID=A0AAW0YUT5_9TREE
MDYSLVESHSYPWTPIGQTSNQLILYHPPSHALQVRPHLPSSISSPPHPNSLPHAGPSRLPLLLPSPPQIEDITTQPHCPYCAQPLLSSLRSTSSPPPPSSSARSEGGSPRAPTRYFRILEQAHEGSRPPSPRLRQRSTTVDSDADEDVLDENELPARGYYEKFFREEAKLGMGAEGSVFLATHVIGGNVLGTYAVKKIAVGRSKSYLFKMLREVKLLEALRHPNVIPYHHSWIDTTRFSSFGPSITALHVLMMYATAGNLDTFLLARSHSDPSRPDLSAGNIGDAESLSQLPREERIKAFKKRRQSAVEEKAKNGGVGVKRRKEEKRGVLLLGLEELAKLFGDVVEGLAFLHANSILHLDLKCSNVLLHWEEGKLIPKAMISDFGTSEEMLRGKRERTGHTGTMEYMAPETLDVGPNGQYRPSDSQADMWSLGMILHKMLFLHLPYPDTDDYDVLHRDIVAYRGFIPTLELFQSIERRRMPRDLLILLSKLAHIKPEERPSAEKVRMALRGLETKVRSEGKFSAAAGSLVRKLGSPWPFASTQAGGDHPSSPSQPHSNGDERRLSYSYSPVRAVLALPSPEDERSPSPTPFVDRLDVPRPTRLPRPKRSQGGPLSGGGKRRTIHAVFFVLKN